MENESYLPKLSSSSFFFSLASVALAVVVLVHFDSILKPLIIAFLIWFVVKQFKDWLGKITIKGKSAPSWIRTILAFGIIGLLSFLVIELLIRNIEQIITSMPQYISELEKQYDTLFAYLNDPSFTEYLEQWINSLNLGGLATSVINSLSGVVSSSLVIVVYVIFFAMEEATSRIKIEKLFPVKGDKYKTFMGNMQKVGGSIRYYLVSKTIISIITGALSWLVLVLMGIDYAFLWAFLVFILNFIPYVGPLISSLIPAIFAVLIKGDILYLLYVFLALEVVQVVLGSFVEPKVMGKGTNLSAIVVLVALAFWGFIWGLVGMILAVPITAVIVIICSQIPSTRYIAILLSSKGNVAEVLEKD
jgi:predicted PurR-regulated permease PerM